MEDQTQTQTPSTQCLERNEPVRSRWTPKPEQILILESIFNSGMVNPPKEETVKIRKLLEKFGSVGDANVFYWFQNRRSRSRRRQRQIQVSLISGGSLEQHQQQQQQQQQQPVFTRCGVGGGGIEYQQPGFVMQQPAAGFLPMLHESLSPMAGGSSSSSSQLGGGGGDEIYFMSGQASSYPEIEHSTSMSSGSRVITVFINGVPTEVEGGPINMKGMFSEDMVLVHSSGVPVPHDEYGVSVAGLQHGESYYLVSRSI
ncbi:WUSCHEL-related homeobox 11-like [Bidens hawaiensis]|uniref:WUSCHEL-related homeobox 11-like n=1 Tax=Bidens hawaiensis TaxID=980011 RepID=UPI00404B71C2